MSDAPLSLGAVIHPGFEMLDMFGPLEMFSCLGTSRIDIHMIAERKGPVSATIATDGPVGPQVVAEYDFQDAPDLDILLVPGGIGTLTELNNEAILSFLRQRAEAAQVVCSVCTGSALLAKAGVLEGRRATSNKQVFAIATSQPGNVTWVEKARWVEDGKFFTSSGVSAGMDMSLAVISRLFGDEAAETVMKFTEYTWHRDADHDPFVEDLNVMAKAMGMI